MKLTTIINSACNTLGITPVYATLRDGNVILDGIRNYPIVVWPFDESITLNREGVEEITRTVELYFAYNYGMVDCDMAELMPLVDDAITLVGDFAEQVEQRGVSVTLGTLRPTMSRFDAIEAGVSVAVTFSYRNCYGD